MFHREMKTINTKIADMKHFILSLIAIGSAGLTMAQQPWYAHPDSIYRGQFGADTRAEAKSRWQYRDYTRATAAAMPKKNIVGNKIYTYDLATVLKKKYGDYTIDESVRFTDQPAAGFCTGFLIAPDLLVTAGHCIENEEDMKNAVWVFDYTSDVSYNKSGNYITVDASNMYYGVELLDTKLTDDGMYDYCVIRLDRKTGRKPYKFRTGGNILFEDFIAMIGSPSGIPLKVADSARVTNNEYKTWFMTDLDAFQGNSGGPVFNANGFIEGILVRGAKGDFEYNQACNCIRQVVHEDAFYKLFGLSAIKGNIVHRMTHIPLELRKGAVYRNLQLAIDDNNLEEFREWLIYTWIWKEKVEGKDNLVAYAVKQYRSAFVDAMLAEPNVNVNDRDINGTPLVHLFASYNLGNAITTAATREGFDIDIKNNSGETALMTAARAGSMDAVKALLRAGSNPKLKSSDGKTARSIAKKAKQKEIASVLKAAEKGKLP